MRLKSAPVPPGLRRTAFPVPSVKALDLADAPGSIEAIVSVFNNVDLGGEVVKPGFFSDSLMAKMPKGVWMHDWSQPVAKTLAAHELMPGDPRLPDALQSLGGLYIKGQFNLDTQRGREAYSDLKFGTIDEFSIGYSVDKYTYDQEQDILSLEKGTLYEWSPVLVGMNPDTALLSLKDLRRELKGAIGSDLPLADRDTAWSASDAEKRVRDWADAGDAPNAKYRRAFLWYDDSAPDNYGSYKLPIADVIGGELKAVPKAIFSVAGILEGARGGVDIPAGDKAKIKTTIEGYYAKMRGAFDDDTITVPWKDEGKAAQPRSGVRFADHSDAVRLAVAEWVTRAHAIAEMYRKEGRTLNSTNRQLLGDVRQGIMAACDDLQAHADAIGELLTATDPAKDDSEKQAAIQHELARFLAVEARAAGIPLPL